jgi:hypothetical protein
MAGGEHKPGPIRLSRVTIADVPTRRRRRVPEGEGGGGLQDNLRGSKPRPPLLVCMGPICSLDFGSILVQTWRDYESCAQRIAKKGEGDCIGQYFAFWKCIDACVRLSIRTGCLSQLLCWGPAR